MELRQYWHIFMRRRRVIYYTFALVAVVSAALVAYNYYGNSYKALATFDVQVQPIERTNVTLLEDPYKAASDETDQLVQGITTYGTTEPFFRAVADGVRRQGLTSLDWKAIRAHIGVYTGKWHEIDVDWTSPSGKDAGTVVTVAEAQLQSFVQTYRHQVLPGSPQVTLLGLQNFTEHISVTKPLSDLGARLAVGLIAGLVLAFLFEYLEPTIQDNADVQRWLGTTTLAVIPEGTGSRRRRA